MTKPIADTATHSVRTNTSVEVLVGLLAERYFATLTAANDNRPPQPKKDR